MEERLYAWYSDRRLLKKSVIISTLKDKAKELSNDKVHFKASQGWLKKFRRNYPNVKFDNAKASRSS
jgi:hypothetical protein